MYWLSTLYTMGSRKQNLLLRHFKDPREAFNASNSTLREIPGITENNIRVIEKNRDKSLLEYGLEMLERMNISYIHLGHDSYPSLLAEITDPPVGLFCLGKFPSDSSPRVAIIGSRRCSEYGLSTARRFGSSLARRGVTVVSGMARGIDSMAHRGAVESGHTIAVLGCGVDICYPPENTALRDQIAKDGCIISEYPLGVGPMSAHFPARNRIISGLSHIVVVVEAGKKSGTLITVDQALEQGRDIMSVPGNITNKYSEGTNNLIKQGAEPACHYEDILNALGLVSQTRKTKKLDGPDVATEEKLVSDVLDFEPYSLEEIVIKTKSQPQTIQYILTVLELKGYVRKLPGARYVKV